MPAQGQNQKHRPSRPGRFPVMVIAHRGFSGAAPENTLASFRAAIAAGSDMVELDARFSKDGEVVVIHDADLERTTNGRGMVAYYTLKELTRLDAGSWFGRKFAGEKIPTLAQVLDLAKGRIAVNIELKNAHLGSLTLPDLAARALEEVQRAAMEDAVLFSSFYPHALEKITALNSGLRVAFLYHRPWNSLAEVTLGRPFSILNLRKSFLTKGKVELIREAGKELNVYTVNKEPEMEKFVRWGVNGIITNHPDKLIRILKRRMKDGG